jgi:DNA-binding winged helix-turn-helix (wHTH) protein/Tfp pilus assembly protein PilF
MLIIADWLFDPPSRRLIAGQEERRLSPKAAGVLLALAEMPGQLWSRDALLERVWPGVTVGEEVLTHAIAEIRKALSDDFRTPRFLETVHKSGYRLICPIALFDGADEKAAGLQRTAPDAAARNGFDLDLYSTYLEACEYYERGGRHCTEAAVGLFTRVIRSDPGFSLAHVGLAKSLTFLGTYYLPVASCLEQALDHCRAAQRIDPGSADALAAEGLIFAIGGRFDQAIRRFRASILIRPDSSETHYLLGRACFAELNVGLAAPMLERAAALRFDDYHSLLLAAKARRMLGDEQRTAANFAHVLIRIEPRLLAVPDDYRALCAKARALVQLGRIGEAEAIMDRIRDHPDPISYHLACTMARAGETRQALDTLEAAVEGGFRHKAFLDRDPDFDAVRQEPRFKAIARSAGAA